MIEIVNQNHGCILFRMPRIKDNRGWFEIAFNQEDLNLINVKFDNVCQLNHSFTEKAGVIRGLNYQESPYEQAKIIRCVRGSLYSVGVNIQAEDVEFGKWSGYLLDSRDNLMMYIPRGFAHGFITIENGTELEYFTDNVYSKEHAKSIRYDDSMINIDWTMDGKIKVIPSLLSEKNRFAGSLKSLKR